MCVFKMPAVIVRFQTDSKTNSAKAPARLDAGKAAAIRRAKAINCLPSRVNFQRHETILFITLLCSHVLIG